MQQLIAKEYDCESEAYMQERELRNRILRLPLGLELSAKDTENDHLYLHFGVFQASRLIGCMQLVLIDTNRAKMKQVVVDTTFQGNGVGSFLIDEAEQFLARKGINRIEMHARESALSFYKKKGYLVEGDRFLEVGIPHFFMYKDITLANKH